MRDIAALVERIREICPDLTIGTVRGHDGGQNNDLLLVDDEWLFRFPRYDGGARRLAVEAAILRDLQGRLSISTPEPRCVRLQPPLPGEIFLGYRRLPGAPLWRETLEALPEPMLSRVVAQLSGFLAELHAVSPDAVNGGSLPYVATKESMPAMYERVEALLFPRMRPDARLSVARHFEAYLSRAQAFREPPVLIHGDCGPSNILFDPSVQRVTGIVDFGGAGLGEAAYDLGGLLAGYGETFLTRLLHTAPELEPQAEGARFYAGTFAMEEALFGIETGDEAALARGLSAYA